MKTRNPDYKSCVEAMFTNAPFIADMGIRLTSVAPGICETMLDILPKHRQHIGNVHGGVLATMAGHTAGAAATTIIPANRAIVGLEFHVNLLRLVKTDRVVCRAEILKPGTRIIVAESNVYDGTSLRKKLATQTTFTFAVEKI
jgi:uncharacterized protein (TIGR00369 family)